MSFARQDVCDLIVVHFGARKLDYALLHLIAAREPRYRAHPHLRIELADAAAAPYNPHPGDIMLAPIDDDFVHETTQQPLAFGVGRAWVSPDLWQTARQPDDVIIERLDDSNRCDRLSRCTRPLAAPGASA